MKTYLLTPGPTPIPESVNAVLSQPIIHHRTPGFRKIFQEVEAGLKSIFQTEKDVLILTCSGTGAMTAAVANLFNPGDQIITINAGKFGERWTQIAQAYGLRPVEIKIENGKTLALPVLKQAIQAHPGAKAILFQASETSTGTQLPTQEICTAARQASMLSVCDAITALGVFDLPMDRWDIDVLITGSQKAFMIPPGLAMLALSDRAWEAVEKATLPRYYFDFRKERKALLKSETAWTPAISLVVALQESLRLMREEGLQNVFKRHDRLARATRAAVQALGLELFSEAPSTAVTAVRVPGTIADGKLIPKTMRDTFGAVIAGGQDELEGKIFRLSHFGYCGDFDITTGISALELTLGKLGHPVRFGTGVGAALQILAEENR
ncbi:MAG: class V aminotransferase [Bdellovibrionales bacterium GWC1_52_8]|nr:MAG: class V aminotransferase [Bdellovibrionales bacterium GWB1_52_6]OFZ05047.1 MAG: class V aminotransferase [Bdellovibrionales bacterium GWA1_52_35]OFZ37242.1 MAG: class V aminotransferase [Bdellovibrionales bacterium GWC1_52_8]